MTAAVTLYFDWYFYSFWALSATSLIRTNSCSAFIYTSMLLSIIHTHSHDGCVRDNIRLSITVIQENWSPDFLIDRQPILPHELQSPNSLQLVLHNLFQLYSNDNEPAIEEVVLKFVCSLLEERGPLRVGRGCASHVCYVIGPSHVRCCVVLYPYIVFTQC